MNSPDSGLGTQVGGYKGHGDANWAAQVAESLAGVQVDHRPCFLFSEKKYLNFQSVLKVQPGRRRPEHAKDCQTSTATEYYWSYNN